jgi:peptidoglycan hydrolase-like protein with peptidoglycan-binding domain
VAQVPGSPAAVTAPPVATAPATTAPVPDIPDENHMTDADRRAVQTGLAKVGYYDGRIDGVFGVETRAAIRRYQHEVNAPMTGIITPGQSRELLSRQ